MKKVHVKISLLITAIGFIVASCLSTPDYVPPDYDALLAADLASVPQTQLIIDKAIIDDSLARESWEVADTSIRIDPSGVRYTIQTFGTGTKPVLTSFITVKYKVRLLAEGPTATPFDSSDNLSIELFRLITAWRAVLPDLKKGTKATLYVPSGLAYGNVDVKNDHGDIVVPKNSNLIFEIELVEVSN